MKLLIITCLSTMLAGACGKQDSMTVAQYEAKNTELMRALTAVFVADGKDCRKLAADIDKFVADHQADMDAVVAFETAHPKAKNNYELATGLGLMREFTDRAGPSLEACETDKPFQDAWARFTKE